MAHFICYFFLNYRSGYFDHFTGSHVEHMGGMNYNSELYRSMYCGLQSDCGSVCDVNNNKTENHEWRPYLKLPCVNPPKKRKRYTRVDACRERNRPRVGKNILCRVRRRPRVAKNRLRGVGNRRRVERNSTHVEKNCKRVENDCIRLDNISDEVKYNISDELADKMSDELANNLSGELKDELLVHTEQRESLITDESWNKEWRSDHLSALVNTEVRLYVL